MRIAGRALDPRGERDATRAGEVVSLATVDAQRVGEGAATFMLFAAGATAILVAATVLLITSVALGLTILVGLPLMLLAARALARPLQRRSAEQHAAITATAGVATGLLTGLRVVKGLGAEPVGAARYRLASRRALTGALRAARAQGMYEGVTIAMSGVLLVVVARIGGHMALDGEITIGELVSALGLTQFLVGPLSRIAWAGGELARGPHRRPARRRARRGGGPGGAARAAGVRGAARRAPAQPARRRPRGRGGRDRRRGRRGPRRCAGAAGAARARGGSGGGRGARRRPAAALPAPAGRPRRGARRAARHGSVRGNAGPTRASASCSCSSVASGRASRRSSLEWALALPEGLGTIVGEGGHRLTATQAQQLALARIVPADPPVVVLDEATAEGGSAGARRLEAAAAAALEGRTGIVIAHRLMQATSADRVVVIEEGAGAGEGTHEELAAGDGAYGRLWRAWSASR